MSGSLMNNEVAIFEDRNGNLKVVPDYVFLKKDKKSHVKFFAVNVDVAILVPKVKLSVGDRKCYDDDEQDYSSFQIKAAKKKTVRFDVLPEESKEYPYMVHNLKTGETIKGNSPPSMIVIDDP